ncbi:alpha/beta hydrolase [Oscillospiraceae bacterium PP1C4]
MGFVENGGAQLYYEITGEGEPLVLLHGNGEDMGYFKHQIPFFSAHYKVIAIDTRAHGRSSRGTGTLDFTCFAQDVIAVLDALQIEKAHILGFSDGGNIALHLVLSHPERVCSLILNGANLNPSGVKASVQVPIVLGYAVCSAIAVFARGARQKQEILGLMVHHPKLSPEQLAPINTPTLVIAGAKDMIRQSHTELIAQSIKNAKLVIVPDASHTVAAEKPEIFNQTVLNFLSSL